MTTKKDTKLNVEKYMSEIPWEAITPGQNKPNIDIVEKVMDKKNDKKNIAAIHSYLQKHRPEHATLDHAESSLGMMKIFGRMVCEEIEARSAKDKTSI